MKLGKKATGENANQYEKTNKRVVFARNGVFAGVGTLAAIVVSNIIKNITKKE